MNDEKQETAFTIELTHINDEAVKDIEDKLKNFLTTVGKETFTSNFNYIIRELWENAERANSKRCYAIDKNIEVKDISTTAELKNFKEFYRNGGDKLYKMLDENKFFIRLEVKNRNNNILLRITNNSEISSVELDRIQKRIKKSYEIKNMREAFKFLRDKSEGGGLGIITIIMTLKKIGGSNESLKYYTNLPGHTIVQVTLPVHIINDDEVLRITDEIFKEISDIPKMPDNLLELEIALNKPDTHAAEIAQLIKKDPGLSVEILKTVNSGLYMLPNKIENIQQAIVLLGFSGLKSIIYTTGTKKVFKYKKDINSIWDHSYLCAKYNQVIANIFHAEKIIDELVLCGFMHDIGKILLLGDTGSKKIESYLKESNINISNTKFEEIFYVMNHALVGKKIAEKWKLSSTIISAIEFHHSPEKANHENSPYVYTTYLSNTLIGIDNGRYDYTDVPAPILRIYNCSDINDLKELHEKIKEKIENPTVKK